MSNSLPDEIVIKKILEGDENAFTHLYERYRLLVYSAAYRVLRDPEDARDAAQEIFLKLYRRLHHWDVQKSKLSSWIYRMAMNHSIDCRRTRLKRAESPLPENSSWFALRLHAADNDARSAFRAVQDREEISLVRRRLDTLPDMQRKTFRSRYFHDLRLVEIAEMEGCNLGTIKSSLYRATRAVRQALQKSRNLTLRKMELPA